MVQRIQSVYLVLAALLLAGFLALPSTWHLVTGTWTRVGILAFALLAIGCTAWALLLFKNRSRQMRVIEAARIGVMLLVAVFFGHIYFSGTLLRPDLMEPQILICVGIPVVTFVLLFLARRGVARDIRLVRSADRLR